MDARPETWLTARRPALLGLVAQRRLAARRPEQRRRRGRRGGWTVGGRRWVAPELEQQRFRRHQYARFSLRKC